MMIRPTGLLFLIILLLNSIAYSVQAAVPEKDLNYDKQNQIIVQYKHDIQDGKKLSLSTSNKIKKSKKVNSNTEIISVSKSEDVDIVINELKKNEDIIYIEKNKKIKIHTAPNDSYFSNQWGIPSIKADSAWDASSYAKKSVVVAVIDSGIDQTHNDLKNKIATGGYNFYSDTYNYADDNGHGTEVSGVIAAQTNNNEGISGVTGNFDVKILPLKIANSVGEAYVSDEIDAINYAISLGVDVINISMGSDGYISSENSAIQKAYQNGITVVASAGNDGTSAYNYPASYNNVISVGAMYDNNYLASYSNFNDAVDVVAPGTYIYTCQIGGSYGYHSGTSFSSPMVSGAVAIIKALNPSYTPSQITNLITSTATDKGAVGKDVYYGFGVVDVFKEVVTSLKLPVTGISLNMKSLKLSPYGSATLEATILPSVALNSNFTWSSSNSGVATVDGNGKVVAISTGSATITATTLDGGFSDSCIVDVSYFVTGIYLNKTYVYLLKGSKETLFATISPSNATNKKVLWTSSDTNIATINDNGEITSINAGTTIITAKTEDGGYIATCTVEVIIPVSGITLDFSSLTMSASTNQTLTATVTPADATDKKVLWSSSWEYIATVDANGLVSALHSGTVVITAITEDGRYTASCTINIIVPVTGISLNKTSSNMFVGNTQYLSATITPSNATNKTVIWTTSDPSIATVSQTGTVKCISKGTATITAILEGKSATCTYLIEPVYTWNNSINGDYLTNIEYFNGTFILAGADGALRTSDDGISWTVRNSGVREYLGDIAWNGYIYVVVGTKGTIITSPDLSVWTRRSSTVTDYISDVIWDGKKFIATIYGSSSLKVLTSEDGIMWTTHNQSLANQLSDIVYNGKIYVAIDYIKDALLTSQDGITWALGATAENSFSLAWGSDKFVAVGSKGSIIYSFNGLDWLTASSPAATELSSVSYHNNQFIAVGEDGVVLTSTDGIVWKLKTTVNTTGFFDLTFGGDKYVAVGYANGIFTSTDTIEWINRSDIFSGTVRFFSDVTYGNGLFVVIEGTGMIATSPDGVKWTKRDSKTTNRIIAITYGGKGFIAVGEKGTILSSVDGITWDTSYIPNGEKLFDVDWNNSAYVALGEISYGVNEMLYSTDGITWSKKVLETNTYLSSITTGSNKFVIRGSKSSVQFKMFSNDGINWTTINDSSETYGLTWGNNIFTALQYNRILTSPDGINWNTSYYYGGIDMLLSVVWVNKQIIGVGGGGLTAYGIEGGTLNTYSNLYTSERLIKVATNGNRVVAIGDYNTILVGTSESGNATLNNVLISQGDLQYNFDKNITDYEIILPIGTTTVPDIQGIVSDPKSTLVYVPATSINGVSKIFVTAENQISTKTYSFKFKFNQSIDNEFIISDIIIKDKFGNETTQIPSSNDFTISSKIINKSAKTKTPKLIVAFYTPDNKLIDMKIASSQIIMNATGTLYINISMSELENQFHHIKIFMFEDLNSTIPLTKSYPLFKK